MINSKPIVFFLFLVETHVLHLSLASSAPSWLHTPRAQAQLQPPMRRQLDLFSVRGGQAHDPNSYANYDEQQQNSNNYEEGFSNYNPQQQPYDDEDASHIFQQTVQDRVDEWRHTQMEKMQSRTLLQEQNPRDEQGRMKLLASVSKGSRAFIFGLLVFRDIHLFETADQVFKKGPARLFAVVPLTLLFIGNLAGAVASFTSPSHSAKKRMKSILNLDKVVEGLLIIHCFFRLTLFPSKFVMREVFVANILHSVFFLIQCQVFTRVTWDEKIAVRPTPPQDAAQAYNQGPGPGQPRQMQPAQYVNSPGDYREEQQYENYHGSSNV